MCMCMLRVCASLNSFVSLSLCSNWFRWRHNTPRRNSGHWHSSVDELFVHSDRTWAKFVFGVEVRTVFAWRRKCDKKKLRPDPAIFVHEYMYITLHATSLHWFVPISSCFKYTRLIELHEWTTIIHVLLTKVRLDQHCCSNKGWTYGTRLQ